MRRRLPARGGPRIEAVYGSLPLTFERNVGQTAPEVDFLARGPGSAVLLTARGAVVRLPGAAVASTAGSGWLGAPRGLAALAATSRYFKGIQALSAPSFARVEYPQVYPGVDLAYYGKQRELEFDFMLARAPIPAGSGWLSRARRRRCWRRTDGFACEPRVETCGWAGPGSTRSAAEKNGKSPRRSSCGARTKRASGWGRTIPNCRW